MGIPDRLVSCTEQVAVLFMHLQIKMKSFRHKQISIDTELKVVILDSPFNLYMVCNYNIAQLIATYVVCCVCSAKNSRPWERRGRTTRTKRSHDHDTTHCLFSVFCFPSSKFYLLPFEHFPNNQPRAYFVCVLQSQYL